MKKRNLPAIIGGLIILLLLVVMIFPQWFTDVNPYGVQSVKAWTDENGKFSLEAPPFAPSEDAPWGTDRIGRDIKSLILHGTKLTIFVSLMVVAGRFLVAVPIGIAAGFGSYLAETVIHQFSIIFSALPALLIGVIILKMNFFVNLYKGQSIFAFVLVLTFIGWAKLGNIITERVQEILSKPFIKAEIAIGKNKLQIALGNVIPHLAAELTVLFFMEIARALTMMMQFGIFGVFIGNLRIVESTDGGVLKFMNISFEPEWASMLGTGKDYIRNAPWTVIYPGVAFFISILGFNMFGEGLRRILQQKDSRFLMGLRNILTFNNRSGQIFVKNKRYSKHRLITAAVFAAVCLLILGNSFFFSEQQTFNYYDMPTIEQMTDNEVLIGTEEAMEMSDLIAGTMEELGLVPLTEEGFISQYVTRDIYDSTDMQFEAEGNHSPKRIFIEGKDYSFNSFGNLDVTGPMVDYTYKDLLAVDDYHVLDGQFVLMDTAFYSNPAVEYLIKKIMTDSAAKGLICIRREWEELPYSLGENAYDGAVVWITQEAAQELKEMQETTIRIQLTSRKLENMGRNVIGMIPGQDRKVGKEAIIIGVGYNFDQENSVINRKKIIFTLQLMRELAEHPSQRNRTIIFAFWDGSISEEYNGIRYYCEAPIYPLEKSMLYIDLAKLNTDTSDVLYYSSDQSPISRFFAFSFSHQLEKNLEGKKIVLKDYNVDMNVHNREENYIDKVMYFRSGIPTVILSMKPQEDAKSKDSFSIYNVGEVLIETILKNNY